MASLAYANNINNTNETIIKLNYSNKEITLDKMLADIPAENVNEVTITSSNNGFFYQLLTSGYDKILKENKEVVKGLEITKKYLDENDKEVDKIKLGDNVTVKITMRSGNDKTLNNIMILDLLPAGFELLPENNVNILEHNKKAMIWRPIYTNRRDDRIMIFGSISDQKMEYKYKIKAVNKGVFTLPAIYSEAMYNPGTYYRGIISSIIVE